MDDDASSLRVSICIPAWNAASFIDRTLDCACAQTHTALEILVSVDQCEDATAERCRQRAALDPRIRVFEQAQRLGWAANCNFLLEQVGSPYFCFYFHDDLLEPAYVERLLTLLMARPDAASVHCDMGHFGASEYVSPACSYEGTATQRLMRFLVTPERGSPLRSLTRSQVLPALRFPTDAVDGLWANEPYLMQLLSAGEALAHHEVLYRRWEKRPGGLTDGWKRLSAMQEFAGYKANLASAVRWCEKAAVAPDERAVLLLCLYIQYVPRMHMLERKHGVRLFHRPDELHPAFKGLTVPRDLERFGEDLARLVRSRLRPRPLVAIAGRSGDGPGK